MTKPEKKANPAASIRARLLIMAHNRNDEFQHVLSEFAAERFLYRLGVSPYVGRFILKGATLFRFWSESRHRATWDIDLEGLGTGSIESVSNVVRDVCGIPCEDGIAFNPESVAGEVITLEAEYNGVRISLNAELDRARIPMQIDVGFGDTVDPEPRMASVPTLLGHPSPQVLVYPKETVVAEKIEAIFSHGIIISRMKDFYDIFTLANNSDFEGKILARSIRATFEKRGTPYLEGESPALEESQMTSPVSLVHWRAFWRRSRIQADPDEIRKIAQSLNAFIKPLLFAVQSGQPFEKKWNPGGPWRENSE